MNTLERICHCLSMQCRFNGGVYRFYSVAEHTVHLTRQAEADGLPLVQQLFLWLHDAPEYELGDIVRKIKKHPKIAEAFTELELKEITRICHDLGLPLSHGIESLKDEVIKRYDDAIGQAECEHVAIPNGHNYVYDLTNPTHVSFAVRIKGAAPYGENFTYWKNAMIEEYRRITTGMS